MDNNYKNSNVKHHRFFGSAFTIMAFNNDVSVGDVFSKLYFQVTGSIKRCDAA